MKNVQRRSYFWSVFNPNAGKYGPEITPCLDTFHAVKLFWNTVKPFMTNKGILTDDKIVIESENDVKIKSKEKNSVLDIKAGDVINKDEILAEMLNSQYVNFVENFTRVAPIGTTIDPNKILENS